MARRPIELGEPLAVRSSAADEDSDDKSAAGQYESVMGVRGADALAEAVLACYAAADSRRAQGLSRRGRRPGAGSCPARDQVVDGPAWPSRSIRSRGSGDAVVLEAAFGHGEGIVSGQVSPDRYLVRRDGLGCRLAVADKAVMSDGRALVPVAEARRLARALRDDEAVAVAELVAARRAGIRRAGGRGVLLRGAAAVAGAMPTDHHACMSLPDGTWTQDPSHYPEPMTPLSADVWFAAMGSGIQAAARELRAPFGGFETATVDGGWAYERELEPAWEPDVEALRAAALGVAGRWEQELRQRSMRSPPSWPPAPRARSPPIGDGALAACTSSCASSGACTS